MPVLKYKKIGEIFTSYINGYAFKSDNFTISRADNCLPVLKIANIGTYGKTDFSDCHFHDVSGYEKFIAHKGDLAFSLTGSLGYVAIITEDCLVNQRVLVITRKEQYGELLDTVQPLIQSSIFTKYCYSKATSENNKNISPAVILDYKIPIYLKDDGSFDIDEQKTIALKYHDLETKKNALKEKAELLCKSNISIDNSAAYAFVDIPLNSIVTHHNGKSSYTKEYCQEHKGNFPVFSANNNEPIGYINCADYCGEYLTYSKNGCAGFISVMSGAFSVNGDRCVLTLNSGFENMNLLYLKYYLEPIFRSIVKGRMGINGKNEYTKLNSTMIKNLNIMVPIPLKGDKSVDTEAQSVLAQKYATIDSIKKEIYNRIQELVNIVIS